MPNDSWLGSVPTWGLLITVLIVLIKTWPLVQKNVMDAKAKLRDGYVDRIQDLEKQVKACQDECAADKKILMDEIHGLRKQHIQEQISFINAVIASIDAPELKLMLNALQAGQRALEAVRNVEALGGPIGDANHERQ